MASAAALLAGPVSKVRPLFDLCRNKGLVPGSQPLSADGFRRVRRSRSVPIAWVIDSKSVKVTETGGPRGSDTGKAIEDRNRQIL